MPLPNGATFAGFRIVRLLGSGGMGEVYLAQHPRLPKQIALKILPTATSSDTEFRERFAREADLAATLYHPHIVGVHDRGESDTELWIAMDFVDGADASRLLTEQYPAGMPLEQVVAIVSAVAGALDYAHRRGMLHRDVKPANIMLTDDDGGEQRILLGDFGIARNSDDISGLTATNMAVGTVAYAAPEQLMGEAIDGRADQYSLAATAYHLLTGSQLFPHSNPAVVISRHLNSPPPKVADSRMGLSALDEVLSVALAKNPTERFTRCGDFAQALVAGLAPSSAVASGAVTQVAPIARAKAVGSGASLGSASVAPRRPKAAVPLRASHARGIQRMLLAVLVAAVVAGAGVYLFRQDDPAVSPPAPTGTDAAVVPPRATIDPSFNAPVTPSPTPSNQDSFAAVGGVDASGFLGFPKARCDPSDGVAMIGITTDAVFVVCRTAANSYYYKRVRLRDGFASGAIDGAVPVQNGFDVTSTGYGTDIEVRDDGITVLKGGDVISYEAMREYRVY